MDTWFGGQNGKQRRRRDSGPTIEAGVYHATPVAGKGFAPGLWRRAGADICRDMAILKIARMGHPVLLGRADEVADPRAPDIRRLIADMLETMEDAGSVGLAAPQVHVPLRLFVFTVPAARSGDEAAPTLGHAVLINPVIEPVGEAWAEHWEGCLSIPGLRGLVRRPARIRYAGLDGEGNPVAGEASGFRAVVMQHEHDHLDGTLYPMRMTDLRHWGFNEELGRFPPDPEPPAGKPPAGEPPGDRAA